ncbi:MAG: hypothetical protein JWL67_950 [Solirubrobacterales bacterium]|jgi:uncharacterized protein YbcI|nr:hypothetical protein [Solirubrobacterales bacterium]
MVEDALGGSASAAVSNAVVRLLREISGRGPTKARTYITGDLIAVVLQDQLTVGAQTLIRRGATAQVLAGRAVLHEAISPAMTAAVEQHSGRRVLAHLSADNIDPDIAVESFVLVPQTGVADDASA